MMPVTAPAPPPLAIDRVERSRAKQDQVRLRLTGRWLTGDEAAGWAGSGSEALLVVQTHGRRHRFAATVENRDGDPSAEFSASFTLPDWAVPDQAGQAVLWVGDDVVPVPPPGAAGAGAVRRSAEPPAERGGRNVASGPEARGAAGEQAVTAGAVTGTGREVTGSGRELTGTGGEGETSGRSGPLSELLFKETVTALRAELQQRTAEVARLRASLAQAQLAGPGSEGAGGDPEVESTHAELRAELRRLMDAVGVQRREFDAELATVRSELGDVRAELEGARAELEGARAELQQARADRDAAREELESRLASAHTEFDQQLAAARAEGEAAVAAARAEGEAAVAAARAEGEAAVAAARAEGEAAVATARREAETEIELARQETETMLAAAREGAESRAEAAEAEARELAARLREHAAGERRRSEEAAILREQLAAAHVARDAAMGEAGGLRVELERVAGELAVLRERSGHAGDELSEARQLLADARALTDRLRGGDGPSSES
jgi:hypothetical protein